MGKREGGYHFSTEYEVEVEGKLTPGGGWDLLTKNLDERTRRIHGGRTEVELTILL